VHLVGFIVRIYHNARSPERQCFTDLSFSKPVWRSVLILLASSQQTCMTHTIAVCTVKNSWWWTEELSETCRVLFQKYIWEIGASSWFHDKKLSTSVSNIKSLNPVIKFVHGTPNPSYTYLSPNVVFNCPSKYRPIRWETVAALVVGPQ